MVSGNIWYNQTWQMMIDIMKCIKLLPVQNKYHATRFICANFDKTRSIDIQKVQVADKIGRDIWEYLVSSEVAVDV